MPPPAVLRGQRELLAALVHADRETRLGIRADLRHVAEPVARDWETLALERIRNMSRSPKWARTRIGVTRRLVYVAPRQKGARGRGPKARGRQFAGLLLTRAMEPALERHRGQIEHDLERTLDLIADDFNRGGPL